MKTTIRAVLTGTAISGSLDILSAFGFSAMSGIGPAVVLRYVASGPFGDAVRQGGVAAALLGILVHYALMAIMVTVFVVAFERMASVRRHPLIGGMAYGFVIYLVMYWVVTPLRWHIFPKVTPWAIGNALFSHLLCVGLSMGYVVDRALKRSS